MFTVEYGGLFALVGIWVHIFLFPQKAATGGCHFKTGLNSRAAFIKHKPLLHRLLATWNLVFAVLQVFKKGILIADHTNRNISKTEKTGTHTLNRGKTCPREF